MRYAIAVLFAALLNIELMGLASAESLLVDACKRATAIYALTDNVSPKVIQDFSNLNPPRVRMRLDDLMSTRISCAFSSRTKPVGLKEFCIDIGCWKSGEPRFEEIQEILRRDGY